MCGTDVIGEYFKYSFRIWFANVFETMFAFAFPFRRLALAHTCSIDCNVVFCSALDAIPTFVLISASNVLPLPDSFIPIFLHSPRLIQSLDSCSTVALFFAAFFPKCCTYYSSGSAYLARDAICIAFAGHLLPMLWRPSSSAIIILFRFAVDMLFVAQTSGSGSYSKFVSSKSMGRTEPNRMRGKFNRKGTQNWGLDRICIRKYWARWANQHRNRHCHPVVHSQSYS